MQQGFFSVQQSCPQCKGQGNVITDPCSSCNGMGMVKEEKTLSVKIPAGVDDGDQVRLSGEGESGGPGTTTGDLYVQVRMKKHEIFERHGDDLYCEVPVSFPSLALGGELEVPTLTGRANLKIPAESQTEKVFRLKGKGVKNVRNGNQGNLYCKVVVETPVKLTKQQKELLNKFEFSLKEGGNRHSPRSGSWGDRIKSFFDELVP
jgi:molecular chaperone DnaJ